MIFCLIDNSETVLNARTMGKLSCPVVALKVDQRQSFPDGVIDFNDLTKPTSKTSIYCYFDFGSFNTLFFLDADLNLNGSTLRLPSDVCVLPFSSGTSGLPKGVMLTHANITSNMEKANTPNPDHRLTLPTTNDFQEVLPCVIPFFHIYGFTFVMLSKLSLGCKLVTLPRFDPETYINTLAVYKATFLTAVPPIIICLTNDSRCTAQHLSSVRSIMVGAAPLGKETVDKFLSSK